MAEEWGGGRLCPFEKSSSNTKDKGRAVTTHNSLPSAFYQILLLHISSSRIILVFARPVCMSTHHATHHATHQTNKPSNKPPAPGKDHPPAIEHIHIVLCMIVPGFYAEGGMLQLARTVFEGAQDFPPMGNVENGL